LRDAGGGRHSGNLNAPAGTRIEKTNGCKPGRLARANNNRSARLAKAGPCVYLPTMITVATCSNPAEAMLLKSLLEANDIEAYVPDELTSQTAVHFSGSGIRIQVEEKQAEAAKRILEEAETTSNSDAEADEE
jgi:hypothetical protein